MDFPRDPNRTLKTVLSTDETVAGAVGHPPWVILDGNAPPAGAEAELVQAFGNEFGIDVAWRRQTKLRQGKHVTAVPQGENDWLMRLETFLRSEASGVGDLLRDHHR